MIIVKLLQRPLASPWRLPNGGTLHLGIVCTYPRYLLFSLFHLLDGPPPKFYLVLKIKDSSHTMAGHTNPSGNVQHFSGKVNPDKDHVPPKEETKEKRGKNGPRRSESSTDANTRTAHLPQVIKISPQLETLRRLNIGECDTPNTCNSATAPFPQAQETYRNHGDKSVL